MTTELETKIKELEEQITKWKFKYNAKNAEYILLWNEFEEYKKSRMNKWIIIGALVLAIWAYYYFKKDKEVYYEAQEEL